jgi:hypothetical protein
MWIFYGHKVNILLMLWLVHKHGDFLYKMGGIASLPNLLAKLMGCKTWISVYMWIFHRHKVNILLMLWLVHKHGDILYKTGGIASLPNLLAKLMVCKTWISVYMWIFNKHKINK